MICKLAKQRARESDVVYKGLQAKFHIDIVDDVLSMFERKKMKRFIIEDAYEHIYALRIGANVCACVCVYGSSKTEEKKNDDDNSFENIMNTYI